MFMSLTLTKKLITRDVIFVVCASLILISLSVDGVVSMFDALVLLMCFGMYMVYSFNSSKNEPQESDEQASVVYGWGKTLLFVLVGIACLIGGGELLVSSASKLATLCGISERFNVPSMVIGLTIVAIGTSLPELVTSIVAARKGESDIAVGNVIGSNIFNIFLILGVSALINPLSIKGISTLDWGVLMLSSILLFVFGRTGHKITKMEGMVLIALYILYIIALVMGWQLPF